MRWLEVLVSSQWRLNPITLTTPKPLLKISEITLLENCINLIHSLGINKILINTFYLSEKIEQFLKKDNLKKNNSDWKKLLKISEWKKVINIFNKPDSEKKENKD